MNRFEMQYIVDYRDVDRYYDFNPYSFMQILGRVSTFHEVLGMKLKPDYMRDRNLAWMLYQWKYELYEEKQYARKLRIVTIPEMEKGIYCYRYYSILDDGNKIIGKALAHWVAVDIEKRRMTRVPSDISELIEVKGTTEEFEELKGSIDVKASRFRLDTWDYEAKFEISFSDVDANFHVNNAVYGRWAIEAVNQWNKGFLKENYPYFVNVVYKKEKKEEGFVKVRIKTENLESKIEILDNEDNLLNLVLLKWKPRDRSFGDFSNYSVGEENF